MDTTALLVFSSKITTAYWTKVLQDATCVIISQSVTDEDWEQTINELQPDLLLIEAAYANDNGLEMARRARKIHPAIRCLIFVPSSTAYYLEALQVDASAYLPDDLTDPAEVLHCISRICQGYRYISPVFVEALHLPTLQHKEMVDALSNRQKQILLFVAQGCTTRQIAMDLGISESTTRNHMYDLSKKVGLTGVYQLKSFAGSVRHLLE